MTDVSNLAFFLDERLGKYEEAEGYFRRALEGFDKALGATHPNTLVSAKNFAILLDEQGKHEDARQLKSKYNV